MSAPADRNRLDGEASPYLRQHADNPVHWQPWDDAALEASRERDVPIFLSIGYSACHWCHVMEEESFVDDAVAELLNESFVPIKVDREERPDLDRIYQTVCQLVSGRGGWPLSVWLTPEGKPFQVGTYFPRTARGGMPGFVDVLDRIAEAWDDPERREELERRAEQLTSAARGELEDTPEVTPEAAGAAGASILDGHADGERALDGREDDEPGPVERAAAAAVRSADREHGGWGSGPKFPQPARVEVLLDAGASVRSGSGSDEAGSDDGADHPPFHEVAVAALAAMVDGGLYDHVGGGFHRYCTDRTWTVPHFEKMLYDNAELPRVLLAAHQVTGSERFATVARETFAFLDRELAHPDGAFASTLDARSPVPPSRVGGGAAAVDPGGSDEAGGSAEPGEDEEGAFYVWTPGEVEAALDDPDLAQLVCDRFGITEAGNFEGATVLTVETSIRDLAADRGLGPSEVASRLDDARETLRDAREERPRPRRDDKVIAAWNGLAIRALAEGAIVLQEDVLADRATEALDAVRTQLWDGESLARRYVPVEAGDDAGQGDDGTSDGGSPAADVQGDGYLEDYAFLGRGALACYEATGAVEPLAFAVDLAEVIVAGFYDDAAGTLYATPAGGEDLIVRPQETADQSTPSSLAVGADLLAALDAFVPHDRFRDAAERVVETHASRLRKRALEHPSLALAAERLRAGSLEVTVASDDRTDGTAGASAAWREWLADRYLPRRVLAPRPASDTDLDPWLDALGFDEVPPIWTGREAREGPTAYVCRGFTCSRPLAEPSEADDWLDGAG